MYNKNDEALISKYSAKNLSARIDSYREDFGNSFELDEILTELLHDCHNSETEITSGALDDIFLNIDRASEIPGKPHVFGIALGSAVAQFIQDLRKGK